MKKALVLLLALSLIGGLVFAEGGKITASGNVQAQWGVDWDYGTSGFKSVIDSVKLMFTLPTENNSVKATGDEGSTSYGEISIGNIRLYAEAKPTGSYSQDKSTNTYEEGFEFKWDGFGVKLVMGQLTLQFLDGASSDINYAGAKINSFWLTNAFSYNIYSGRYGNTANQRASLDTWGDGTYTKFDVPGSVWEDSFQFAQNYGIVAKYSVPSLVDIALDVASFKAWDSTDAVQTTAKGVTTTTTIYWDASAAVVASTTNATTIDVAGGDIIISSSSATTADTTISRLAWGDQGDNAYTGRFTASVTAVPGLTAQVGVAGGYVNPGYATGVIGINFGGKVGYDVAVGDTIKITPQAAMDVATKTDFLAMYAAGGVKATVMGATVVANAGFSNIDTNTAVTWPLAKSAFACTVTADAGTLVPNLIAKAAFEWIDKDWDNTKDETYGLFADLGYGILVDETTKVTPWTKVSFDNKSDADKTSSAKDADKDDQDLYVKLGIDVAGLLKNTTFTAKWESNDLIQNIYNPLKVGQFVLIAKVSF